MNDINSKAPSFPTQPTTDSAQPAADSTVSHPGQPLAGDTRLYSTNPFEPIVPLRTMAPPDPPRKSQTAGNHLNAAISNVGEFFSDLWDKNYGELPTDVFTVAADLGTAIFDSLFPPAESSTTR